jgi:hypothetical protein
MSKNSNARRRKRQAKKLQKAAQNTTTEQRASKRQVSTAGIKFIKDLVNACKPYELSPSQRYRTYALMMMDDAVWSSFDSRATAIERAQANGRIKYKKSSSKSKEAKEFLEYCMKNMHGQTPRSVGRSCAEMVKNGSSPHEMVLHKREGKFGKYWTLKKLAFIDPATLDTAKPFSTNENGDEITFLHQKNAAYTAMDGMSFIRSKSNLSGQEAIDWRKIAISSYSATSSTPLGTSPLDAAYTPWREKQFLQETLLVGVTRDFSGVPVLRLPSDVLEAAESDPSSPEAQQVAALTDNMQMMHTADATYVVLPSDGQSETGVGTLRDYDMEFKGIEGSGKNFAIESIIEQKKRAIYTVLSSQHLITGENGGGSMNLHEGQVGISALISDRDNMIVDEMWNKQVFPLLLRFNGFKLEEDEIPTWEHGDVQPRSDDEKGKLLQRMGSVALLPKNDPIFMNEIMKFASFDYAFDESLSPEEVEALCGEVTSRGGEGQGSSGTGNTQVGGGGSATNSDNSA